MSDEQTRSPNEDGAGTVRETTYKQPPTREQVPATEAVQAALGDINATTVLMNQSASEHITAERVSLERSAAKTIDAKSSQLDSSKVVALGSDHAVLLNSQAVQVVAEEARISKSRVGLLISQNAELDGSRVLIFSGTAGGEVTTALTARSAAVLGAAAGLAFALATVMLKAVFGK